MKAFTEKMFHVKHFGPATFSSLILPVIEGPQL